MINYTSIFETSWDDSKLLKKSIISFLWSFIWTLIIFFGTLVVIFWFSLNKAIVHLYTLPDSISAALLFGIAFLQMSGWIWILQWLHKFEFWNWFWFKNDTLSIQKIIFYGIWLAIVLYFTPYLVVWLLDLIKIPNSEKVQTEFLVLSYPIFAIIFFPLIWMIEEIFFRWVLQNLISKNKNFWVVWAILISSIIFTSLHAFQYWIKVLIVVFILSVILWISYYKFKSLRLNMFAHYLNNMAAVITIIITSGSLATKDISAMDYIKLNTNNTPEYNIFIKSFAIISGEDPYEVKYNPYTILLSECTDSKTVEDIYNDINDIKDKLSYSIDLIKKKISNEDRLKLEKKFEKDRALKIKSKYIYKCNYKNLQFKLWENLKEAIKYKNDKTSIIISNTEALVKWLDLQMDYNIESY